MIAVWSKPHVGERLRPKLQPIVAAQKCPDGFNALWQLEIRRGQKIFRGDFATFGGLPRRRTGRKRRYRLDFGSVTVLSQRESGGAISVQFPLILHRSARNRPHSFLSNVSFRNHPLQEFVNE
jgi:hypothetical protein